MEGFSILIKRYLDHRNYHQILSFSEYIFHASAGHKLYPVNVVLDEINVSYVPITHIYMHKERNFDWAICPEKVAQYWTSR